MQNESLRSSNTDDTTALYGVHQDPHRVTIHMPGWNFPVGYATPPEREEVVSVIPDKGTVTWTRYKIDQLDLSHGAGLMVLQGIPLGKFFQGCFFVSPESGVALDLILLKGQLTPLYKLPLSINGIILGSICGCAGELLQEDMAAAMLRDTRLP